MTRRTRQNRSGRSPAAVKAQLPPCSRRRCPTCREGMAFRNLRDDLGEEEGDVLVVDGVVLVVPVPRVLPAGEDVRIDEHADGDGDVAAVNEVVQDERAAYLRDAGWAGSYCAGPWMRNVRKVPRACPAVGLNRVRGHGVCPAGGSEVAGRASRWPPGGGRRAIIIPGRKGFPSGRCVSRLQRPGWKGSVHNSQQGIEEASPSRPGAGSPSAARRSSKWPVRGAVRRR